MCDFLQCLNNFKVIYDNCSFRTTISRVTNEQHFVNSNRCVFLYFAATCSEPEITFSPGCFQINSSGREWPCGEGRRLPFIVDVQEESVLFMHECPSYAFKHSPLVFRSQVINKNILLIPLLLVFRAQVLSGKGR